MTDDISEFPPEDAFALLGNETRIRILRSLWEIPDDTLSFSALRERVGARDSGQFNYHLNQLTERFVRRTDDGYELTYAGDRVIGAIVAGTYTKHGSLDPFEIPSVDSTCCAAPLRVEYRDEQVTVRCSACERLQSQAGFPAGVVERHTQEEFPNVFRRWLTGIFGLMKDGICPNCDGQMNVSIVTDHELLNEPIGLEYECVHCHNTGTSSIGTYFLDHPAVVSFYYDHAIDIREEPTWTMAWLADEYTRVLSDDPWRFELTIPIEDETLTLTIDENLTVIGEHRERSST